MVQWHAVGPLASVAEGINEIEVGGELALLVRRGDLLRACAAHCPHKFTALVGGTVENGCITCPLHEASFGLDTGRPQPGQEWAGLLATFPVRVKEGVVEVQL